MTETPIPSGAIPENLEFIPRPYRLPQRAERPVVAIVAMDSAIVADSGLAVLPIPSLKPGMGLQTRQALAMSATTFRWLGDAVSGVCRPGERVLFVAEKDGYGPSIARGLGISIGAIEGLLLDLNAIEPDTRVDVASRTWRSRLYGRKAPQGRKALKQRAVDYCRTHFGVTLGTDAAEAACLAQYALEVLL